MDSAITLSLIVGGLLLGGAVFWQTLLSPKARVRRALRQAPLVPIAQVRDGQVARIAGQLALDRTEAIVEAPLTGRACACWEVTVQKRQRDGEVTRWITIIEERGYAAGFTLVRESRQAWVVLEHPQFALKADTYLLAGHLGDARARCQAFLARHLAPSADGSFERNLRYSERALEDGDAITVLGRCRWELTATDGGAITGYRDQPLRLRVSAAEDAPVMISEGETDGEP